MDESEDEVIILYLLTQRRKRKRVGVHELLQRSKKYGEFHHLVQELYFHPEKFRQYFRMTEQQLIMS